MLPCLVEGGAAPGYYKAHHTQLPPPAISIITTTTTIASTRLQHPSTPFSAVRYQCITLSSLVPLPSFLSPSSPLPRPRLFDHPFAVYLLLYLARYCISILPLPLPPSSRPHLLFLLSSPQPHILFPSSPFCASLSCLSSSCPP